MHKLVAIFQLCLLIFTMPVQGEDVIVPVDDYPPWKIVSGGSVTGGVDIALTDHLLGKIEGRPVFRVFPWKRCLSMMQDGSADLISGLTRKKKRETYLYYLQPPYKTNSVKVFFVRKGSSGNYRALKDFENKTVGLLRGAKYFDTFHANRRIKKFEVNRDLQGLQMVSAGRIDAFILTRENGQYLLAGNHALQAAIEEAQWSYDKSIEVYFAVSRRSKFYNKRNALERALREMVASGTVAEIIETYLE